MESTLVYRHNFVVLFTHMSVRLFLNLHSGFPSSRACLTLQPVLIISGKTPIRTVINFRGILGSRPFFGPHPGRKDRRFGEMAKKGRLTCARTLSFTKELRVGFHPAQSLRQVPLGSFGILTCSYVWFIAWTHRQPRVLTRHQWPEHGRVACSHSVTEIVLIRALHLAVTNWCWSLPPSLIWPGCVLLYSFNKIFNPRY